MKISMIIKHHAFQEAQSQLLTLDKIKTHSKEALDPQTYQTKEQRQLPS